MMEYTILQASEFLRCRNQQSIARCLRAKKRVAPLVFSRDRQLKCLAKATLCRDLLPFANLVVVIQLSIGGQGRARSK